MADCKVNHAGMDTSDLRLSEDLNCKTTPHKADFIDHGLYGEEASTVGLLVFLYECLLTRVDLQLRPFHVEPV